MSDRTQLPIGPRPENPYCMRCSRHLGSPFHETNEHDEAWAREKLRRACAEIVWGESA